MTGFWHAPNFAMSLSDGLAWACGNLLGGIGWVLGLGWVRVVGVIRLDLALLAGGSRQASRICYALFITSGLSLGLIGDVSGQRPEYEVEEPDPRHLR